MSYLKISRPRFWIYLLGPFVIGIALGINSLVLEIYQLINLILFGFFFLFPANFFIYGINDVFDYATDKVNPKKQSYELVLLPKEHRKIISRIIYFVLPFWIYSLFLNMSIFMIITLFIFLGYFYSAPPFRFKSKPFLDSFSNLLYMLPGLVGYYLIGGRGLSVEIVTAAILWCAAMHAYSAVPDIAADRKVSISTIATKLGARGTIIFCLVMYVVSSFLVFPFMDEILLFGFVYAVLMISSLVNVDRDRLFSLYKIFPLVNAASGFLIFWLIVLQRF